MNNQINAMTIAAPHNNNEDAWNLLPVHHFTQDMDGNPLLDYFRTNGAFGKVCAAICRRRGLDTEQVEIEWYKDENGAKVEANGMTVGAYPVWVIMAVLMQYEERAAKHYADAIARLWAGPQAQPEPVTAPTVVDEALADLKARAVPDRNDAMRRLFDDGVTVDRLVRATGLAQSTVQKIVRGR